MCLNSENLTNLEAFTAAKKQLKLIFEAQMLMKAGPMCDKREMELEVV